MLSFPETDAFSDLWRSFPPSFPATRSSLSPLLSPLAPRQLCGASTSAVFRLLSRPRSLSSLLDEFPPADVRWFSTILFSSGPIRMVAVFLSHTTSPPFLERIRRPLMRKALFRRISLFPRLQSFGEFFRAGEPLLAVEPSKKTSSSSPVESGRASLSFFSGFPEERRRSEGSPLSASMTPAGASEAYLPFLQKKGRPPPLALLWRRF